MPGIGKGTVCIFGAGGPMGAVTAPVLAEYYTLRLADPASFGGMPPFPPPVRSLISKARVSSLKHFGGMSMGPSRSMTMASMFLL